MADAADFLKVYTQYTLDDYLFRLSIARIQFLAVDNTHTKYLKGSDKDAWAKYKELIESQKKLNKLEDFFAGDLVPDLAEGEEIEIPVKKKN